jgi:molecular chaperone GrpE
MAGAEASQAAQEQDGAGADPATRLAQLEQALAEARQQVQTQRDQYLRAAAELDNVRKRAQRDVENASRYGLEKFAAELLPVLDSLELAVSNAARADARSLAEGQSATLKLLNRAFEKLNIRPIEPVGAPFDPALHEAVMAQESSTAEPNAVLQVVQRGYELAGRLLRPARVIVAKAPAADGGQAGGGRG